MKLRSVLWLFAVLPLVGCFNSAVLDDMLGNGTLDEATIAAGLKEALTIGTERSSSQTSKLDGFYRNPAIQIVVPDQYSDVARTLRDFGLGSYVDDFEEKMNRAAERASGEAIDVFAAAIRQMSISDAVGILNGPDNAATEYFRRTTSTELTARFQPIVTAKMQEVGVYNVYEDLVSKYNALPIQKPEAVDIDEYVTQKTLDGLFHVLEGEEKRIREDPVARTTELLRKVFGETDPSAG